MQEGDTEVCYLANKDSLHICTVPMTKRREEEPWQNLWAELAGIGRRGMVSFPPGGVDGDGDEMNLFLCSSTPMCLRVPTSNGRSRMAAPALTYKCVSRETQGTPVRAARRTPE
jgi:hypothetical protein